MFNEEGKNKDKHFMNETFYKSNFSNFPMQRRKWQENFFRGEPEEALSLSCIRLTHG